MEITKISIFKSKKKKSTLKAFASVEFDECFVVSGIKVLDGKKGLFVAMPSNQGSDDEYYDVAFPITKEFREELSEAVLDAYDEELEDDGKKSSKKKSGKKKSSKKSEDDEDDEEDEE